MKVKSLISKVNTTYRKKKSIFFKLEYWKSLQVHYHLDVMHIEKNVCESIIGTMINILRKTKERVNVQLDLVEMGLGSKLSPRVDSKKTYLPLTYYLLSNNEKKKIVFQTLSNLKVPKGYCSSFKNLMSLKELELFGIKSHDYHAVMQQLLLVALCLIFPKHVRYTILCIFFYELRTKVVDVPKLNEVYNELVVTLCLFEKYFHLHFLILYFI